MFACSLVLATTGALPAAAQLSAQMREGFPGSGPVARYTPAQTRAALRKMLNLASTPALGEPVSLTPTAPYAKDGSHLSFWKPSFVLATADGGEAGVNFWGLYNEGHVNVGFTRRTGRPYVLDCRMLSTGGVDYKVYAGASGALRARGAMPRTGQDHYLLMVTAAVAGEPVSVELWPSPTTARLGFLGCDLSMVGEQPRIRGMR
jgi:hypothetical protein